MTTTVLIDGDIFCYSSAAANEYETQWDDWVWSLHSDLKPAITQLDEMIDEIAKQLEADRVVIALSHGENFRKEIFPDYKFHRKAIRKPIVYQPLRDYLHETREVFERPGLEGDDVLGILLTHPKLIPGHKICVSLDKDMQTLPGLHLNDGQARKQIALTPSMFYDDFVREISLESADRYHLLQALSGDTVDGYPGCPGVGAVGAEKLLDSGKVLEPHEHTLTRGPRKGEVEVRWIPGAEGTPWEIVVSAYRKAGLSEAVALTQARVARICRWQDYDFKEKRVRLWNASTT